MYKCSTKNNEKKVQNDSPGSSVPVVSRPRVIAAESVERCHGNHIRTADHVICTLIPYALSYSYRWAYWISNIDHQYRVPE